jgi:hypothetical protein
LGRAFVVHGHDGGRIACALLTEGAVFSASGFVPYPGYSGELSVKGTVSVSTSATTQTIAMAFSGLDMGCATGAGTAANSCGVHIHSGKTCSDASLVGGHYYTGSVTSDPWTSVAYSSADGTYTATVDVTTGGDAAAVAGRAFIVHGYNGGRIGCALLLAPALPSAPSPPSSAPSTSLLSPPPLPPPPPPSFLPPPSSPTAEGQCFIQYQSCIEAITTASMSPPPPVATASVSGQSVVAIGAAAAVLPLGLVAAYVYRRRHFSMRGQATADTSSTGTAEQLELGSERGGAAASQIQPSQARCVSARM